MPSRQHAELELEAAELKLEAAEAAELELEAAAAATKLLAAAAHVVFREFESLNENLEEIRDQRPNLGATGTIQSHIEETRRVVEELKKICKKVYENSNVEKTPEIIDEIRRMTDEVQWGRMFSRGLPSGLTIALKNMTEEATKAKEKAKAMKAGNNREDYHLHVQIIANDAMKIVDDIFLRIDNGVINPGQGR